MKPFVSGFVLLVASLVFWTGWILSNPAAAQEALPTTSQQASSVTGQAGVILDTSAYWRFYMHGGPIKIDYEAMKAVGEKLLGNTYKEMERTIPAELKKKGRTTDDWRKEVHYPVAYLNLAPLKDRTTSSPPLDWTKADFDDSDWSCYRRPFKMGKEFLWDGYVDTAAQMKTTYFRGGFEIDEPVKAGELALRLVYRGGVCAYLNGQEIVRGHLPAGELTAETTSEAYPLDAYVFLEREYPKDPKHQVASSISYAPSIGSFLGDFDDWGQIPQVWQEEGKIFKPANGGRGWCTQAGWDRVRKLRDRVVEVKIPAKLLRKGANVLAVEVHTSEFHPASLTWNIPWRGSYRWEHGWLLDVKLSSAAKDLPSAFCRPAGVQVWPVDVNHRLYHPEYRPPGNWPKRLRIVAAKNGTFSAQAAVGTDHELTEPNVSVSDFKGPNGATLPAAIVQVLYGVPRPEQEMALAGWNKGNSSIGPTPVNSNVILERFSKYPDIVAAVEAKLAGGRSARQRAEIGRISFFDQLSPTPPGTVPADSCQAVWCSVTVPRQAAAGKYTATVKIQAKGMNPTEMPLELEVADWCLPDAKDFQAIIALEQSPYGVAREYNAQAKKKAAVRPAGQPAGDDSARDEPQDKPANSPPALELWSDEHFRLMEKSLKLLGRVGNDFLGVPVLARTELGNANDSPIRITRKTDGKLSFDFSRMDRYIDLALKHWGNPPWCICFVVDHAGTPSHGQTLPVFDEPSGQMQYVQIGPAAPAELRRNTWRTVSQAIAEHMRGRGLLANTYWGLGGDGSFDPALPPLLREFVPQVKWACYSHQRKCDEFLQFCANVRMAYLYPATSLKGWKALTGPINCWLPRHWNSIAVHEGVSAPAAFRIGLERALASGCPGMARAGADYWQQTWCYNSQLSPYAGNPIVALFWPGADGAESSLRFEMLCEGAQETEARIFLEQAMEKLNDAQLTKQVTEILDRRLLDTCFALTRAPHLKIEEYISGWQKRSRELYQAAGQVAKRLGVDLNRSQVVARIPVRGAGQVELVLRNWSSEDRAYTLSSEQEWVKPPAGAAKAKPGFQKLTVKLDGTKLESGKPVKGALVLTDVATGRQERVAIDADVSQTMQLASPTSSANVAPEGGRHPMTLLNSSGAELEYAITASPAWVKPEPAKGKLAPGAACPVVLAIVPAEKAGGKYDAAVQLTESGGGKLDRKLTVHVVPEYKAPASLPSGATLPLEEALKEKGFIKSYVNSGQAQRGAAPDMFKASQGNSAVPVGLVKQDRKEVPAKSFEKAMLVRVVGELTLNIEGKGFTAFSAEVGTHFLQTRDFRFVPGLPWIPRLHFEVHVDGKFAGHSGLMQFKDAPRLLVVTGLKDAKELRLVTRVDVDQACDVTAVWGNPTLYK